MKKKIFTNMHQIQQEYFPSKVGKECPCCGMDLEELKERRTIWQEVDDEIQKPRT